ncbi:MAG: FmdB family transcriptional regulator [Actinomycetota bacterium]|nr:FmdB family transcriptional regulator [Actinomycetota bacterium]
MPIYSYACRPCAYRFDIQQAFTDDSLTQCPQCDGSLRKIYSAVGVVFKGSGFYRNDSRKGSDRSEAASVASGRTGTGESSGSGSGGESGKPGRESGKPGRESGRSGSESGRSGRSGSEPGRSGAAKESSSTGSGPAKQPSSTGSGESARSA